MRQRFCFLKRVSIFASRNKNYELKSFDIPEFLHPSEDGYVNAFGVSFPRLPLNSRPEHWSILLFCISFLVNCV